MVRYRVIGISVLLFALVSQVLWAYVPGQVISTAPRVKIEFATVGGGTEPATCQTSPCTIYRQSGGFTPTGFIRNSQGQYTVGFVSGTFSAAPTCTCIANNIGVANTFCEPGTTAPTSTSFPLTISNNSGNANDGYINIVCVGPY